MLFDKCKIVFLTTKLLFPAAFQYGFKHKNDTFYANSVEIEHLRHKNT